MDLTKFRNANGEVDFQSFYAYIIENNLDLTGEPKRVDETNETEVMSCETTTEETNETEKLFNDIYDVIDRCVFCTDEQKTALTLWVAHTYFTDKLEFSPLLVLNSTRPECGKTTVLRVLHKVCKDAHLFSYITVSSMKRFLNQCKGESTFLFDEADTFLFNRHNSGFFTGLLNSGHLREGAVTAMTEQNRNGAFSPTTFNVWGPKVIAGIRVTQNFEPSTLTRSLLLNLIPKKRNETVVSVRDIPVETFESIKERCQELTGTDITFTSDNSLFTPRMKNRMSDRQKDNWRTLLQIANLGGDVWLDKARETALLLCETVNYADSNYDVMTNLLEDIRFILEQGQFPKDEIPCSELTDALVNDEYMRWRTYNGGRPATPNQIGRMLGEYGIRSRQKKINGRNFKCYLRDELEEVFSRYIPQEIEDDEPAEGQSIRLH